MLLGTPGLRMTNAPVYSTEGDLISTNTIPLPAAVLDFTSEAGGIAPSEISFLPEDTTFARRYYKNPQGEEVMLSVVLMGTNRRSIHRPQVCLTGQGWTIERSELLEIEMSRPSPYKLPVMRLTASRPFRLPSGGTQVMKAVYVYWFVADGQLSARHGQRQWWMARDLLTEGLLQRWAYVSCLAIGRPGTEEAMFNRIETFLKDSVPTFQIAPEQSTP
jgi:EpsI family protein